MNEATSKMRCWSCIDDAMYQYSGQSNHYDTSEDSKEYIKQYEEMGRPEFECSSCGSKTRYQKRSESWYIELKE